MLNEEKRKLQEEAIAALKENNYNGFVVLPTGTGKTWILIESLKRLCEREDIKTIWYLCDSQLLRDSGFDKELEEWNAQEFSPKIIKMCYKTAYKKENENVDLLLADEADFSLTPNYVNVYLKNNFKYKILVSATLTRDKASMLKNIANVVYHKRLQEVEERKIVNKSNYFSVPFLMTDKESSTYRFWSKKISELIEEGKDAMFAVNKRSMLLRNLESSVIVTRKLVKHLYNKSLENKMLIFCGSNEQANKITKYSFHGDTGTDEYFQKFNEGELRLLSVCGKLDRGVNLHGVNNIIFESATGSETQNIQRNGRGKRLPVDDILDVYYLIPYYKNENNVMKPTRILDRIESSFLSSGIDIKKMRVFKF